MTFKVTILGTGSAKPTIRRHHSAHALNVHEQFYLVDCGEGTQTRLVGCGINPLKINAVFISHLHGDHVYGLFPLISSMGIMGRKTPLTVFAPAPFGEVIECHYRYFDTNLPFEIIYKEVDTRSNKKIYENNVMEVFTIPLRHRIPAAGYLFKEKEPQLNVRKEAIELYGLGIAQIAAAKNGKDIYDDEGGLIAKNSEVTYIPYAPRSFAYCSDTLFSAKVSRLVSGVDLLYHEATFMNADKTLARETGHSTTLQAAKVALTAGVDKLLIGHFSSRYKDDDAILAEATTIFPATELAVEMRTYEIAAKRSQ